MQLQTGSVGFAHWVVKRPGQSAALRSAAAACRLSQSRPAKRRTKARAKVQATITPQIGWRCREPVHLSASTQWSPTDRQWESCSSTQAKTQNPARSKAKGSHRRGVDRPAGSAEGFRHPQSKPAGTQRPHIGGSPDPRSLRTKPPIAECRKARPIDAPGPVGSPPLQGLYLPRQKRAKILPHCPCAALRMRR